MMKSRANKKTGAILIAVVVSLALLFVAIPASIGTAVGMENVVQQQKQSEGQDTTADDFTQPDDPPAGVPDVSKVSNSLDASLTPYRINASNYFEVVRNASVSPVVMYGSAQVDPATGEFLFPSDVTRIFIEVGTNDEPELGPLLRIHKDAALIGFEPQPGVFTDMLAKFPTRERLVAFPAAVTPFEGFVPMFVSAHKGCSSLLSMNDRARAFAKKEGKRAPRKSGVIQLRTLAFCASVDEKINVPAFPLKSVLNRIPSRISIDLLMIDAQGFDAVVVSTVGPVGKRVKFIVLECQDLAPGNPLFLVKGAPSCDQQRKCFEASMPHRLEFCWDNAPKAREYNCLYRRPDVSIEDLPKGVKIVSQPRPIFYPTDVVYECPKFLQ